MMRRALTAWTIVLVALSTARAVEPPVTALAFAPDGAMLAVGSQAGLELRRWPDLVVERQIATDMDHIHSLAYSPDGQLLAVAGGTPAVAGVVQLHDTKAYERVARAHPHDDLIYDLAWSPDGNQLATAGGDHRVWLLNVPSLEARCELTGHSQPVLALAALEDGQWISAGVDQTIRVWKPGETTATFALNNHTQSVLALGVRPTEPATTALAQVASAGADATVRLWQPTIGRLVRFSELDSLPRAICWTADGRMIAAACDDGRVRLVNPETAALVATLPALEGVAYSIAAGPDNSLAVGGQDGQVVRVLLPQDDAPAESAR